MTRNTTSPRQNVTEAAGWPYSGVPELCELAANGLVSMLDPRKQLFCYRLNHTPEGLVREGISHRYTIMSLLGLHRLEARNKRPSQVDTRGIFCALLADLAWVDNIGDLGLLVWLCAMTWPERLEEIYFGLDVRGALSRFRGAQDGVTMEIAWFLSGLAHAALADVGQLPDLPALAERTLSLLIPNQGKHGTFGHQGKKSIRGRIGSFADQAYPIYALSKHSEAFHAPIALERARQCGEAICRAQGSLGQWWWHYDASTGKVFQRYPVYSVHQHGMAPMALFALGEAARSDFDRWIYRGLAWIDGKNELDRDLRETSSNLVWRSVYRGNRGKAYLVEFADFLTGTPKPVPVTDLDITAECRPYELGWLLYAFGGPDHT
jgi:hypothetical protein